MTADFRPRVSSPIRYELIQTGHHFLEDGLFTSPDQLRVGIAVLDNTLARLAQDAAYKPLETTGGDFVRNTGFWIDDPAGD